MRTLLIGLTGLLLSGCLCGRVCTEILVFGVTVRVTDASGIGRCDATVDLSDGAFTERLMPQGTDPATCFYSGAGEREGNYRITVTHPSFVTATVDDVKVVLGSDGCHVTPQMRTVALQPR